MMVFIIGVALIYGGFRLARFWLEVYTAAYEAIEAGQREMVEE